MRTWEAMREQIHGQLERQTGEGVDQWNKRIVSEEGEARNDEPSLRQWLS